MSRPDFAQAREYALQRLKTELPDYLTYHCLEHTADDVVPAVEMLCDEMGIHGEPRLLLLTAAYYHDIGFIYQPQGHEAVSARIAHNVLPRFGYSQEQIDVIDGLIMATKMPQNPQNQLQEIIADADMDSLGREDFFQVADKLRAESEALGSDFTDPQWYQFEIDFLTNHTYFTDAARRIRGPQKQQNLARLHDLLEKATP